MNGPLIVLFSIILLLAATIIYVWYQLNSFKAYVEHLKLKIQRDQTILKDKEQKIIKLEQQTELDKIKMAQLKAQTDKYHFQLHEKNATLANLKNQDTESHRQLLNKIDHYEQQIKTLVDQLKLIDEEKTTLQNQIISFKNQKNSQSNEELKLLKEKFAQTKSDLVQTRKELEEYKLKFKNIDPKTYFSLKKRCSEYSRLYNGMRGLKEMAEDQNKNFEVALTHLSRWTLSSLGQKPDNNIRFGELIGEALEKTGGVLIDEDLQTNSEQCESANEALNHSSEGLTNNTILSQN